MFDVENISDQLNTSVQREHNRHFKVKGCCKKVSTSSFPRGEVVVNTALP